MNSPCTSLPSFLSPSLPLSPGCQRPAASGVSAVFSAATGSTVNTNSHPCTCACRGVWRDALCQGAGLPIRSSSRTSQTWHTAGSVFTCSHFLALSSSPPTMGLILGPIKQQQQPHESEEKGKTRHKQRTSIYKQYLHGLSNHPSIQSAYPAEALKNFSLQTAAISVTSPSISLHPVCRVVGFSQWFKSWQVDWLTVVAKRSSMVHTHTPPHDHTLTHVHGLGSRIQGDITGERKNTTRWQS